MFENTKAFSGFSVDDVEVAEKFYSEKLGVKTEIENDILLLHLGAESPTIAYPKGDDHQPASFTILNFPVEDVGAGVEELRSRGVEFEVYEGMPQDDDGVMRGNGPDIAWFKDPAGNICSVIDANDG